jgi:hypothetical protein
LCLTAVGLQLGKGGVGVLAEVVVILKEIVISGQFLGHW